jgi:hypothetical protein
MSRTFLNRLNNKQIIENENQKHRRYKNENISNSIGPCNHPEWAWSHGGSWGRRDHG